MTSSVKAVTSTVTAHTMNRIDIATGVEFDAFIAAFEEAAPPVDRNVLQQITERGGSWDDVVAAAERNAPNGLMVYWKLEGLTYFSLAGHTTKAVEYLLGNHTIAETMFGYDPKILMYAPLRLLVHADADGNAIFSMDQPSTAFGSLKILEVSKVGESLDRKVVNLLRVIGIDADRAFGI
ncbi:hypothetical protein A5647_01065 [Mycobacterium sp. 1100029.7]|nr:hypothetical protein A5647_01065 [Mycobacterium sp. 1100029.7]